MATQIGTWKSIITLTLFLSTNLIVVFPFSIPIYVPFPILTYIRAKLVKIRILSSRFESYYDEFGQARRPLLRLPINLVTMPLLSVLLLLCLSAIGRSDVHDGIIAAHNIVPIDIMATFFTFAYLGGSLDSTGVIRFLAFWILQKRGEVGHRLYFELFCLLFGLGAFIGNELSTLCGTRLVVYLTLVTANIKHPRAWIYAQFAAANISSAIFVSSNPTNLVLSSTFQIPFARYTLNMVVPVIVSAAVLFPFLLYIIFPSTDLVPYSIDLHALEEGPRAPHTSAQGAALSRKEELRLGRYQKVERRRREIMDPFLDRKGAFFGGVLLMFCLTTLLATNAAGLHPGLWTMVLPAGALMFVRDIIFDWGNRERTRNIARRKRIEKTEGEYRRLLGREPETEMERAAVAAAGFDDGGASTRAPAVMTTTGANKETQRGVVPSSNAIGEISHQRYAGPFQETKEELAQTLAPQPSTYTRGFEASLGLSINGHYSFLSRHLPLPDSDTQTQIKGIIATACTSSAGIQQMFTPKLELRKRSAAITNTLEDNAVHPSALVTPPRPTGMTRADPNRFADAGRGDALGLNAEEDEQAVVQAIAETLDPDSHPLDRELPYDSFLIPDDVPPQHLMLPSTTARDLEVGPMLTASGSTALTSQRRPRPHGQPRRQMTDRLATIHSSTGMLASIPEQLERLPSIHGISVHSSTEFKEPDNGEHPSGHADPVNGPPSKKPKRRSLYGAWRKVKRSAKETFPTVCAVVEQLPLALLPFALSMFILVQGLVTNGWVEVFANGWNAWVTKTGTVGAVGSMGLVSVLLCNFGGTNIGATILLSRVLEAWFRNEAVSERMRDASIYALALGVNYGAFSVVCNAPLVGLLWEDILLQNHIHVRRLDFARVNLPIIAIAMSVSCGVLTAQVFIFKDSTPTAKSEA